MRIFSEPELRFGRGLEVLRPDREVGVSLDPAVGVHVTGRPRAVNVLPVLREADLLPHVQS